MKRKLKEGIQNYVAVCSTILSLIFTIIGLEFFTFDNWWSYVITCVLILIATIVLTFVVFIIICLINLGLEKIEIPANPRERIEGLEENISLLCEEIFRFLQINETKDKALFEIYKEKIKELYDSCMLTKNNLLNMSSDKKIHYKKWKPMHTESVKKLEQVLNKLSSEYSFLNDEG